MIGSLRTRKARTALGGALILGAGLMLISVTPADGQPRGQATDTGPDEVIVRFEASTSGAERNRALDRVSSKGSRGIRGLPGARLLEIPPNEAPAAAAAELEALPGVEWAEPNREFELHGIPDDPSFSELWGLENTAQTVSGVGGAFDADIDATEAWDTTTGSKDVLVGVVDSGIQPDHPDLAANHRSDLSRNFVAGNGGAIDPDDWDDERNHGSHVAGTIAAVGSNGVGVAGVNWDAGVFAARACDFRGSCSTASVAEALSYSGSVGARVVNASLGGPPSNAIRDAIAAHPDTLFVASAGNDGDDNDTQPTQPCTIDLENVLCVAATTQSDGLAGFSNYGSTSVDLGAPGVNILSTVPELSTTALGTDSTDWDQDPVARWFEESAFGWAALSFNDTPPLPSSSELEFGAPLDLSSLDACRVRYFLQLDTTPGEQLLVVEASADGVVWTPVQNAPAGYSGSTGSSAFLFEEDLRDLDGQASVRLRYRLQVAPSAANDAALVRILAPSVVCRDSLPAGGAYGFLDGTSMASPHVAGVAALLFARNPALDVAGARQALLASVDRLPALSGTTTSGGRLNAAKALAALSASRGQTPSEPAASVAAPGLVSGRDLSALTPADVCSDVPPRPKSPKGKLTLSKRQLFINQRVSQAAVRRANAIERWLDAGLEGRDVCGGTIEVSDLGPGIVGEQGPDRSPRAADPRPVQIDPAEPGRPNVVALSARQLLVNQRVSQAAIRRAAALEQRLEKGLTGGDFVAEALGPDHLVPGLAATRAGPAPRPPKSRTDVAKGPRDGGSAFEPTLAQLEINQKIGQAAVRRTNALLDQLERGIRGSEIRPGSLASENFAAH